MRDWLEPRWRAKRTWVRRFDLRRVRIAIGSGDDPRLDVEGFLALTSNTAQFGAHAELFASAGPLNISGSLGFECADLVRL